MRFKNFSNEHIEYNRTKTRWVHPGTADGSFIEIDTSHLVEPGEVTADFDEDDPIVQLMLRAHPELRPLVVPTIYERLRKPGL